MNVVAKYGGTSMAQPAIVTDIINSRPEQKIIVCSAPGKSNPGDHKLTDHLIKLLNQPDRASEIDNVIARFRKITAGLDESFQSKLLESLHRDLIANKGENFLISRGEYYSAWALAERINAKFIDASQLFVFETSGKLDRQLTAKNIKIKLGNGTRFVVPGFYGADNLGNIHLFGRGGSDRSGAIIAASLGWDYQNWTDVDGIMNADPEVVPEAQVLEKLTYQEIREGAHGGTSVVMGDSILDLEYGKCDTILKNTFNPDAPGSRIVSHRNVGNEAPVVALSARDDLLELAIHDLGMRDRKGYLAKIMKILAKHGISIEHMPMAQDSISLTFHRKPSLKPEHVKQDITDILISPSASCSLGNCGVVYLVGERLSSVKDQQEVIIEALQALEQIRISVLAIMMHADSPSVAVILNREQTKPAQKKLFEKFLAN